MMESNEKNDVKWGNKLGYILLPFHIHGHNDPLEYVIKAKKVADRKKHSLEAIFTRFIAEFTTKCFGIEVNLYTCGRKPENFQEMVLIIMILDIMIQFGLGK